MFDVISFGSATLDVFIQSPALWLEKSTQVESGQALFLPYETKVEVKRLVLSSGGGGTNTAVGFARLGLKAAVVARCGWDFAGRMVRQEIKKEGVDDSLLVQIEGEKTDYSTILIGPDGGRTILVYRGGTRLEKSVIDRKKLKSQWFYLASLEGNLDLLTALLRLAEENKIKVAINPGRRELDQREKLLPLLEKAAVLIVNQEEAAQLTGRKSFTTVCLREIASLCNGLVAVTRGKRGAYLLTKKDRFLQGESFRPEVVDATGAGDAFGCGLVTGLIKGWPLKKAFKLGLANGAAVVTEVGTKAGLLRERNLHNWLEKPLKMEWQKTKASGKQKK